MLAASVTGCANDNHPLSIHAGLAASAKPSMLGGPLAGEIHDADLQRAARQTVSAKMLAAIALERVTGRTPDPSRFYELR